MAKYLVTGNLTDVVGRIIDAHIELEVEEENDGTIEALVQDKNFATHLFYEGKLVVDNFIIDDCGPFDKIEYKKNDKVEMSLKELNLIIEGLNMCENSYIDPAAINEIKKVKNKVWDYYKQEKVE